jgi:hypothetical protein
MGINGDNINIFEYTKIFKEEINKFSQNMPWLKDKINNCIIDFTKNKFKSLYYRKPLKNWEFKKYNLHELELWWDYRIIIQIVWNTCYFLNFWTHSSLNLSSNKKLKINPLK